MAYPNDVSILPGKARPVQQQPYRPNTAGWGTASASPGGEALTAGAAAGKAPWGPWQRPQAPQGALSGPGFLEQAVQKFGGQFFDPSTFAQWWDQNQGKFNEPTAAGQYYASVAGRGPQGMVNNSQTAFEQYQRQLPQLTGLPSLDPYYQNAETRAQNSLAKQQAARGVYGSSVAAGQAGDVTANLNAERANRESDYELQRRAANQQALQGLTSAARGADVTNLGQGQLNLGWLSSLGDIARGADASKLAQTLGGAGVAQGVSADKLAALTGGMTAAGAAQGAQEGRLRGTLDDLLRTFGTFTGPAMGVYGGELNSDQALLDAILSAGLGGANNDLIQKMLNDQKFLTDAGGILNLATSGKGLAA